MKKQIEHTDYQYEILKAIVHLQYALTDTVDHTYIWSQLEHIASMVEEIEVMR